MDSPNEFVKNINACSYENKENRKLFNLSFFLGAGFSKAWDDAYPIGQELFSIDLADCKGSILEFALHLGYSGKLDFYDLKEIFYQVSMQSKYPSLRNRYVDLYNLKIIDNDIRNLILEKFQTFLRVNYINDASEKLSLKYKHNKKKESIINFFHWILNRSSGHDFGIPIGLRINFITTNYDFLIESIIDETLSEDDSHHIYSYRGFTPERINGKKPITIFHDHALVQNLIKINGGFEIFETEKTGFELDYTNKINKKAPIIILPNREQDYTGEYFQTIFPKAIRTLQDSMILVIVGYALPEEDALLRILLRQFAEDGADGVHKVIFYVDLISEEEQKEKLQKVFPYIKLGTPNLKLVTFSGTFSDWTEKVLKEMIKNEAQ